MSLTKAVARGVGYPLLVVLGVLFLPITVGIAVATNYRGTAERFSSVPGVEAEGSLLSGAVLGVVFLVVVAGVIGGVYVVGSGSNVGGDVFGNEPTPTESPVAPTESVTATPTSTSVQTVSRNVDYTTFRFCNRFEQVAEDSTKLEITEVSTDGTNCDLIYTQDPPLTEDQISRNVSVIAGGYLAAVNNTGGGHPNRLNVEVEDPEGSVILNYFIKTEWAKQELRGEISTMSYANKTHDTIEITGQ